MMLLKLSNCNLNLLRSNGFNLIRNFADKTSTAGTEKPKAKPIKKSNDDSVKKQTAKATTSENIEEQLGKPGKPSDTYQSPEYFNYNEYSYNDLFVDMQKFRNEQPKAK